MKRFEVGEVFMTHEQRENLQRDSYDRQTTITQILKENLQHWYSLNKDSIDQSNIDLRIVKCTIKLDEDTKKIYNLFLYEAFKSLLDLNDSENLSK